MNDYDGVPLVAGHIMGMRSFTVDMLGRLHGPVQSGYIYRPGVNTAQCVRSWYLGSGRQAAGCFEVRDAKRFENCACGFYSYWNGQDNHSTYNTLTAIVKCTGMVTIGQHGMRAEKLEVVAIRQPGPSVRLRLAAIALALGGFIAHAVYNGVTPGHAPDWAIATTTSLMLAWIVPFVWTIIEGPDKFMQAGMSREAKKVSRLYGVPLVRGSKKRLCKKYEVVTPAEVAPPSPDSDEFWSRETQMIGD